MKRSDFLGLEFDWFAIDSVGSVAMISSAGYGSIPDAVFDNFDIQQAIADKFEKITGLPEGVDLIRIANALAKIGVFAYDWKHWKGPYRRIEQLATPTHIDTLGFDPSLKSAFVQLLNVRFSMDSTLSIQ